jgi:hypothetical protein
MDIEELFETKKIRYPYYGRLSEIDFLKRIYKLNELPSLDDRFDDAEGDIWQHTVNNDDYEAGWVFEDERFQLLTGADEVLLSFLCAVFYPAVRAEKGYWKEFFEEVNGLLRNDGYELYSGKKISGRDVYSWREYKPEENALFIPFSQRNMDEIGSHKLKLSISKKARNQIFQLLSKFTEIFQEISETGWQYNVATSDYLFRDLGQFYTPKCFDAEGKYVQTSDLEPFIMNNSPFYVLDAIEVYEKHSGREDFVAQVNAIFKLNSIPYKFENGRFVNTLDVSISKATVASIGEGGLKELVFEATRYYSENNKEIAVEKIWDAFERLKSYYSPALDKAKSAEKIINDMSNNCPSFREMYEAEFRALTSIGNSFRIRHHETTKIDISDSRQYDYFYKRCLALISVAILYLQGSSTI